MGYSATKHTIDDFFVEPTTSMDNYNRHDNPSMLARVVLPTTPPKDTFTLKAGQTIPQPSGTMKEFIDDPFFWRGYTSDEEVASPIDNDDFSFISSNNEDESAASVVDGRYHTQNGSNAQQVCSRAQAVQVVSAGKAKVVTMPKVVDLPAFSRRNSDASRLDIRPPVSRMNRMDLNESGQYSNSNSNYCLYPSSKHFANSPTPSEDAERPIRRKIVRRKPNLPRLQVGARSESPQSISTGSPPQTTNAARRINFLDDDPFPFENPRRSRASPSPSKSRMYKLSSSFSLRSLSRVGRRRTTPDGSSSEDLGTKKQFGASIRSLVISDMHIPSRTSSKPMRKMVPRGADERAPPIELPPCPDDYEDGVFVPLWPPKKDSVAIIRPTDTTMSLTTTMHDRRKSISAFVSTRS